MERHFACTACGKCCYGLLPLTLRDAIAHAGRFPLVMIWTPVRQGSKSFSLVAQLGATMRLPDRKHVAVLIAPTAYIPPSFPCPALTSENLCGIHEDKPSRCRAMPFYPYREEGDQADLLVPRKGWTCDVSAEAPVVYRHKEIVDRHDFDCERHDLVQQAPALRKYAESMIKFAPWVLGKLSKAALKPQGGKVVMSFSYLLATYKGIDASSFARQQLPVLMDFAERTAGAPDLSDYHKTYSDIAKEVKKFASG